MMDDATRAIQIANQIKPQLAGLGPEMQGAVLAELFSIWLAGHPEELWDTLIETHMEFVLPLARANAKLIRGGAN